MKFNQELSIVYKLAKPYRWSLCNLLVCIVVTSFVGMLYPYIFGILVDQVFYNHNKESFLKIITLYGVVYVCEQSLHLTLNAVWSYLMTRFLFDIRKKTFEKMLKLPAKWFHGTQTGNLLTLINKDTEEFMNLIHWNIFYVIANVLRLSVAILLISTMNVYLALLMVVVVPLAVYISMFIGAYVKQRLEQYRDRYGKTISWIYEIVSGIRDIQLMASERNVTRGFVRLYAKLIPIHIQRTRLELTSSRIIALISLLSDFTLYAISMFLIVRGQFTVGGFIACIDYFGQANALLNNLSSASTRLQQNRVSLKRIFDVWNEPEEQQGGALLEVKEGRIDFNELAFQYTDNVNVLEQINLTVLPKQKLALVGESGSGKTTLIYLLLRFYEPVRGEILIDHMKLNSYSLHSLRKRIGVVMQNPILFDGTIRANLLVSKRDATDADIWAALEKANLAAYVRSLPDSLDTRAGDQGRQISGGQKQRLAIARIFLKNPSILIFDEATSALDSESESLIQIELNEVFRERTTLIIAHRLSSIEQADQVAFIDNGRIAAVGTHQQLLEINEAYAKLLNKHF